MKKIFIIILNFNGGRDILECLRSLQSIKVPKKIQIKILVVDNGSNDGSVESIRKMQVKGLQVLENRKNLGFAAGNNIGIKCALKTNADLVMLLNQDTIVSKDFLLPILENPADIISPVIKFKRRGRWIYDLGGRINWWTGRTKHLELNRYSISRLTDCKLDYVSGCAMLIKRPVLKKVGLFDENYYLYFEDVDYCLRAKKRGFAVDVEPKSIVFHKLSETKKKPLKQNIHLIRSNLIFLKRYISFWKKPLAFAYWFLISVKILLR